MKAKPNTFKIGDEVFNAGKNSRFRGHYGIVTGVTDHASGRSTIYVKYESGNEGHPHRILEYKHKPVIVSLPEDLFTL